MGTDVLRYPLRGRPARDALAVCTGLVLGCLLLLRVARALGDRPVAVVPLALVALPAALFAGYLGRILRDDLTRSAAPAFEWSVTTLRVGVGLLVLTGVYLLPTTLVLAGTVGLVASTDARAAGDPFTLVLSTVGLLVSFVPVYLLPGALAAAARGGVRAGLSRAAFDGLTNGSYLFAWGVAASLVGVSWSVLVVAGDATVVGVIGAVGIAYAHVVAARLLAPLLGRGPSDWS